MKPTLLQNVAAQLTGQAGVILIQILYAVMAARLLDLESFGIFSFAFGLVQMILIFSDLGLNFLIVRQVSLSLASSRERFSDILSLKILVSVGVGAFLAMGGFMALDDLQTAKVLALFAAGMVIHSVSLSFNMAFQGYGELHVSSLMTFLLALLQLLLGGGFLAAGGGVLSLGGAYFLSAAGVLGLNCFLFVRRMHKVKLSITGGSALLLLKQAVPLGMGAAFNSVANRIDVPLLLYFSGAGQVAVYSAAYRFTGALNNLPVAFLAAVLPLFSRESWGTREMENLVEKTLLAALTAGAGVLLLFTVAGPGLLLRLFGATYQASGAILRILIWAVVPAFANLVFLHASASQKETAPVYPIAAAAGATANLLLNLWWIPLWKAPGAAAATVVTELVVLAAYLFLLRKQVGAWRMGRPMRALAIGLTLAATMVVLSLEGLLWAAAVLALYLAVLFWTGSLSSADWSFWRQRAAIEPAR
ncbi:MAG: oligosaccharide flippase family protein [Acidobacteria bacterium]|nr:oligosaccharide flippase family protein [Acidobacteriota bacterium]